MMRRRSLPRAAPIPSSIETVVAGICAQAASRRLVLAGPISFHGNRFVRIVVIAGRDRACVALACAFEYDPPSGGAVQLAEELVEDMEQFDTQLRANFREVRFFSSAESLTAAAQHAFPSTSADQLQAAAQSGESVQLIPLNHERQ